jgi:hypothetical protein
MQKITESKIVANYKIIVGNEEESKTKLLL